MSSWGKGCRPSGRHLCGGLVGRVRWSIAVCFQQTLPLAWLLAEHPDWLMERFMSVVTGSILRGLESVRDHA